MKFLIVLITTWPIFNNKLQAQKLNGEWVGNYSKKIFSENKSLKFELTLVDDSIINGKSHLYYPSGNYEHHKIIGSLILLDSAIFLEESLIESSRPSTTYEVIYKLKLFENDSFYILKGYWRRVDSYITTFNKFDKVTLKKKKLYYQKKEIDIQTRSENIQKTIGLSNNEYDSIKFSIYDNGVFDNDSISLYFNDSLIINNQLISERPIIFYLTASKKNISSKIRIIANNLGDIPPNTTLVIIDTKLKRYEINLTSSLQANSVIEFLLLE